MNDRAVPGSTFYVTGLPRSRTAWLAVALSDWHQVACLHEPLARVAYQSDSWAEPHTSGSSTTVELSELKSMLNATHCPHAGISDSGLPIVAPDLPTILPGPILVVWRDPRDVIESLTTYLGGDIDIHAAGVAAMVDRLERFAGQHDTMAVEFDALSDLETLRKIWYFLLPGVRFQKRRIESLIPLRIDPDPAKLLDGVTASAAATARSSINLPSVPSVE